MARLILRTQKVPRPSRSAMESILTYVIVICVLVIVAGEDTCPESCECNMDKGILNCPGVSAMPVLTNKGWVKSMILSPHNITAISVGDLSNFTSLTHLNMSCGSLASIEENSFSAVIGGLTRLDLKGNKLQVIPKNTFVSSIHLVFIDFSDNSITQLANSTFVGLHSLNHLDLSRNNISIIGEYSVTGTPLKHLDVSYNQLKTLPVAFFQQVPSLTSLFIRYNALNESVFADLPSELLPNLLDFSLAGNALKKLLMFPKISSNLQLLDLSFCGLNSASLRIDVWTNVSSINTLHLSGNTYHTLFPYEFQNLTKVSRLYMSSMEQLHEIDAGAFTGLVSLKFLDLSDNNALKSIHDYAFVALPKLRTVLLNNSSLTTVQNSLLKWPQLETVALGNNDFLCNCSIMWMANMSYFGNNSNVISEIKTLTCAAPSALVGRQIIGLNPASLGCGQTASQPSNGSKVKKGLVVAAITCLCLILLVLLIKFRKRIYSAARRQYQYHRYKNDMVYVVEHDTTGAELEDANARDTFLH